MFGLGIWEIALIAVVALLVLGPDKLPDAARSLGKALRDFRRAGDDIKREIIGDMDAPARPATNPVVIAKPLENTFSTDATIAPADPHYPEEPLPSEPVHEDKSTDKT